MDSKTLGYRSALLSLIKSRSYREGDFTLASGKKSTFYVDLKATTLHPDGAFWIGELAVALARAEGFAEEIEAVGGLTLGADPIATSVSLAARSAGLHWSALIVRKEPKDHGTSRWVEGSEGLRKGARVLVVEDVSTTGASSVKAVERLRESGFDPVAVLTVVDREQGAEAAFQKLGVKFYRLATLEEVQRTVSLAK